MGSKRSCVNLACGDDIRKDWVCADIDSSADPRVHVLDLRNPDGLSGLCEGQSDIIEIDHGLQYLNYIQAVRVIELCFKNLLPGGELHIEMPDPELVACRFLECIEETDPCKYIENIRALYAFDIEDAFNEDFRGATYQFAWTRLFIRQTLSNAGFANVFFEFPTTHGCRVDRDYRVIAVKGKEG